MFGSNCCFLTCTQVSQEVGKVVWYSHLFTKIPQLVVIHTVKGFSVVNEEEVDVFLELPCFFYDSVDVGNLISGSPAVLKSSLTTNSIFHRTRTNNFTICMEIQKTLNSQSNLEKEEWNWRNQPAWHQTILQSHSHQDSMVLAQRQIYRSMEQNRKPRDKSANLWSPYLRQRRQGYTMEKRQPL